MSNESPEKPHRGVAKLAALRIATSQHGVIHLEQAVAAGMARHQVYRLVRIGEWQLILPRVVAVSVRSDEWIQRVRAACLWGGRPVAASHVTAGLLWQLDGVETDHVHITRLQRRSSPRPWLTVHETGTPFAIQRRQGIPATNIARTLTDLATVVPRRVLRQVVEDALRKRLTRIGRLSALAGRDGSPARPGKAALLEVVAQYEPSRAPTETELERRGLEVLRGAQLPAPRCQHVVVTNGGKARLDFAYPEAKLGIECDSYRWHSGRDAWSKDRTRSNALIGEGWRVLHTTWDELRAGAPELVAAIRHILGQQNLP